MWKRYISYDPVAIPLLGLRSALKSTEIFNAEISVLVKTLGKYYMYPYNEISQGSQNKCTKTSSINMIESQKWSEKKQDTCRTICKYAIRIIFKV